MSDGIPIRACGVSVLVLRPRVLSNAKDKVLSNAKDKVLSNAKDGDDGWRVLLLRRAETHLLGVWSYVSGGIEPGERGWEAALRELSEETSLVPLDLFSADVCEQFYEPAVEQVIVFPVFVALVAAGAEPILNHEHSEYRWVTRGEAAVLLPFAAQRNTLRHVWAEFVEHPPLEYLRIPIPGAPGPGV